MKLTIELPQVSKSGKVALPAMPRVSVKGPKVKLPAVTMVRIAGPKVGLKSLL